MTTDVLSPSTAIARPASSSGRIRVAYDLLLALLVVILLALTGSQHFGPIDPAAMQAESLDWHGNSAGPQTPLFD